MINYINWNIFSGISKTFYVSGWWALSEFQGLTSCWNRGKSFTIIWCNKKIFTFVFNPISLKETQQLSQMQIQAPIFLFLIAPRSLLNQCCAFLESSRRKLELELDWSQTNWAFKLKLININIGGRSIFPFKFSIFVGQDDFNIYMKLVAV